MFSRTTALLALAGVLLVPAFGSRVTRAAAPPARQEAPAPPEVTLEPTAHPAIPDDPDALWLAPTAAAIKTGQTSALLRFADGVNKFALTKYADALPML